MQFWNRAAAAFSVLGMLLSAGVMLPGHTFAQVTAARGEISFLDRRIYELADSLIKAPIMDQPVRLAVVPFSDLNGGTCDFGKYISENLIVQFTQVRRFSVMERELITRILEEHKLSMLGLVDPATARKIGRLLGVDYLVTGTFSALNGRVKVNARVVATESGMIMTAAETIIPRSSDVDQLLGRGAATGSGATPEKKTTPAPQPPAAPPVSSSAARAPLPAPPAVPAEDLSGDSVTISLASGRFHPVTFVLPASHRGCSIALSDSRPGGIHTEPAYPGGVRKYGTMRLGTNRNNEFHLILDDVGGQRPVMYFDKNQNGDLTDDGGPMANQGSSKVYFAGGLTLPFGRVREGARFPEYKAWLFLNEHVFRTSNQMCHYSTTQFKGQVRINGDDYLVYLVDSDMNDADFTNDGIYIDLDRNGQIDSRAERVDSGSPIQVGGGSYYYRVVW